jgi:hypothetical protein
MSIAMVGIVVVGCTSSSSAPSLPVPSTSAVPSPEVVCDGSQFQPPPSLTCSPAISAAFAVLGPGHPPIIREEFRWGGLCPPGAPCAPPLGNAGIVIFNFASDPFDVRLRERRGWRHRDSGYTCSLPVGLLTGRLRRVGLLGQPVDRIPS